MPHRRSIYSYRRRTVVFIVYHLGSLFITGPEMITWVMHKVEGGTEDLELIVSGP